MGKLVHGGQVYADVNKYIPKTKHKLIPRMTSDTTPKGSCSASYVYSGRYAYYGFTTIGNGDINYATEFWYNGAGGGNYIQYDFEDSVTIFKIGFGVIEGANIGKTFKVQFSDDSITFVDGDTFTVETVDWVWYELSAPKKCLSFRIYVIDNINIASGIDAFGFAGGYAPLPTPVLLYTLDETAGARWINSEIDVSNMTSLIFSFTSNGKRNYFHEIAVEDIAVYTGGTDVFTTIFNVQTIGNNFNVRIYNDLLYVSFQNVGASTDFGSVYEGKLNI